LKSLFSSTLPVLEASLLIESCPRFFHLFVSKFAGFLFLQRGSDGDQGQSETVLPQRYSEDDDLDQCHYYLQKLLNVLKWSPDTTWAALAQNNISTDKTDPSLHLISMSPISDQELLSDIRQRAKKMTLAFRYSLFTYVYVPSQAATITTYSNAIQLSASFIEQLYHFYIKSSSAHIRQLFQRCTSRINSLNGCKSP
jgi:hypothetical protein